MAEMNNRMQHDLGSPLVLVVDDDSQIRRYIKIVMQSAGVQVLEAEDGFEALEVFRVWRGRIDLVITDIRMPRLKGTDLAILLRRESSTIPLIFVSGEPIPPDMNIPGKEFLFIEKPFAAKVLLDAACRFLQLMPVALQGGPHYTR
jgi:two-component system cell cycle sensor histidine kinase/response regulator CckA